MSIENILSRIPHLKVKDMVENVEQNFLYENLISTKLTVLYGPPGIGKTSNAIQFSYRVNFLSILFLTIFVGKKSYRISYDL